MKEKCFLQPRQEVKKEIVKEEKPSIPKIEKRETQEVQYGVASWYGPDFHGKPTSSGEIYDMYQLTCAHNTFPLGTTVMVTNLENGRSVELKVNDRGPFVKERIIDLSYAAAQMLGMWEKGTAYVKVEGFGPLVEEIQRFTVQVGSFIDEANAQKLADQLRKGFENVYVNTLETLTTEISSGQGWTIRDKRTGIKHCRETLSDGLQGLGDKSVTKMRSAECGLL